MQHTTTYLKNFSTWREERAKKILEKGNPEVLDEYTYLVPSQTEGKRKVVNNNAIESHHTH